MSKIICPFDFSNTPLPVCSHTPFSCNLFVDRLEILRFQTETPVSTAFNSVYVQHVRLLEHFWNPSSISVECMLLLTAPVRVHRHADGLANLLSAPSPFIVSLAITEGHLLGRILSKLTFSTYWTRRRTGIVSHRDRETGAGMLQEFPGVYLGWTHLQIPDQLNTNERCFRGFTGINREGTTTGYRVALNSTFCSMKSLQYEWSETEGLIRSDDEFLTEWFLWSGSMHPLERAGLARQQGMCAPRLRCKLLPTEWVIATRRCR